MIYPRHWKGEIQMDIKQKKMNQYTWQLGSKNLF